MFLLLLACTPDASTLIDGILLPDVAPVTWAGAVDIPYVPLPVGAIWSYVAETPDGRETDDVEVLAETRTVNGVPDAVVYDVVSLEGDVIEETWDGYARDSDGNVWYLGEDTCEFENGGCVTRVGAWEGGVDGALRVSSCGRIQPSTASRTFRGTTKVWRKTLAK